MSPYPAKRLAIWSLCLLLPLVGCDGGGPAPGKPAVVSQKVTPPETAAPKPAKKDAAAPAPVKPAAGTDLSAAPQAKTTAEAPAAGGAILPFAGKDFGVAYGYNPEGKVDPFRPLLQDKPPAEPQRQEAAAKPCPPPRTPLERIDLAQLKLVAVLRLPSENRALVEESTGKGYIITAGTHVGPNCGVVKEILVDRLLIDEKEKDIAEQNYITRTRELVLLKPLGE